MDDDDDPNSNATTVEVPHPPVHLPQIRGLMEFYEPEMANMSDQLSWKWMSRPQFRLRVLRWRPLSTQGVLCSRMGMFFSFRDMQPMIRVGGSVWR